MNDVNSLSHTSWNCKYHIVFAPKYRRKVFYGQKRKEIRLRERGRTGAEVLSEADILSSLLELTRILNGLSAGLKCMSATRKGEIRNPAHQHIFQLYRG